MATSLQSVDLGTAGNFVILSQAGVTATGAFHVTGGMGISPIARTAYTGFSEVLDASGEFANSTAVTGNMLAADMAVPTPALLTTAIGDMQTAFADAAGRLQPLTVEEGAGNITGLTLAPGLRKWGTSVTIDTSGVTLLGGPDDVWIFQIAGDLSVATGSIVTLEGGAQAKNIFWQVSGKTTLGTGSQFQGIILCKTQIVLQSGATLNGRAYAQTAVTLDANTVTLP